MDKSDKLSTYIRNSSSVAFSYVHHAASSNHPKPPILHLQADWHAWPMRSRNPCIAIDHDESAYASEVQTKAQNKSPAVSFARRYFQSPRAAYQPKALRAGSEAVRCLVNSVRYQARTPAAFRCASALRDIVRWFFVLSRARLSEYCAPLSIAPK